MIGSLAPFVAKSIKEAALASIPRQRSRWVVALGRTISEGLRARPAPRKTVCACGAHACSDAGDNCLRCIRRFCNARFYTSLDGRNHHTGYLKEPPHQHGKLLLLLLSLICRTSDGFADLFVDSLPQLVQSRLAGRGVCDSDHGEINDAEDEPRRGSPDGAVYVVGTWRPDTHGTREWCWIRARGRSGRPTRTTDRAKDDRATPWPSRMIEGCAPRNFSFG